MNSSIFYPKSFSDSHFLKCETSDFVGSGYDSGISLTNNSPFSSGSSSTLSPSGSNNSPTGTYNAVNASQMFTNPSHIQKIHPQPPPLIGPTIDGNVHIPVSTLLGKELKTTMVNSGRFDSGSSDLIPSTQVKDCETIAAMDLWHEFCRIHNLDGRKPQRRRRQACQKIESGGKCKICSDTATGFHYDVLSCEGCKGFFRRSVTSNTLNRCVSRASSGMKCDINIFYRRKCQECRFISCLEAGMRPASLSTTQPGKGQKKQRISSYSSSLNSNHNIFDGGSPSVGNKVNNNNSTFKSNWFSPPAPGAVSYRNEAISPFGSASNSVHVSLHQERIKNYETGSSLTAADYPVQQHTDSPTAASSSYRTSPCSGGGAATSVSSSSTSGGASSSVVHNQQHRTYERDFFPHPPSSDNAHTNNSAAAARRGVAPDLLQSKPSGIERCHSSTSSSPPSTRHASVTSTDGISNQASPSPHLVQYGGVSSSSSPPSAFSGAVNHSDSFNCPSPADYDSSGGGATRYNASGNGGTGEFFLSAEFFKYTSNCEHQERPYGPLHCNQMCGNSSDYFHSLVNALEMYGPKLMQANIYIPTKWPSQDDCERMDPKEVHYLRKKHLTEITVLCINALIECFKNFDHFFGKFDEQVLFHLMCKSFLEMLMVYMAQAYDPEKKKLHLLSGIELDRNSLESGGLANFCDPMLKFAESCHSLDLQKEEYYLLGALILFQPHKITEDLNINDNSIERQKCIAMRDIYLEVLIEYEKLHRPPEVAKHLIPRLLLLLADLSELRHVHERFFDEFDVNAPVKTDLTPPLLQSIWKPDGGSPKSPSSIKEENFSPSCDENALRVTDSSANDNPSSNDSQKTTEEVPLRPLKKEYMMN